MEEHLIQEHDLVAGPIFSKIKIGWANPKYTKVPNAFQILEKSRDLEENLVPCNFRTDIFLRKKIDKQTCFTEQ